MDTEVALIITTKQIIRKSLYVAPSNLPAVPLVLPIRGLNGPVHKRLSQTREHQAYTEHE